MTGAFASGEIEAACVGGALSVVLIKNRGAIVAPPFWNRPPELLSTPLPAVCYRFLRWIINGTYWWKTTNQIGVIIFEHQFLESFEELLKYHHFQFSQFAKLANLPSRVVRNALNF